MMTGKVIEPSLPKRNMKRGIHWNWSLGLVLAVLPLAGWSPQECFSQPTNSAPADETAAVSAPTPAEATTEDDVVDAPATPISTAKTLPSAVKPTGLVAEVLKLADSGVEESVILVFVTNSTSTFNLGAEEIIYLNDIGVPSVVVTAMIQRDQALKAFLANAGPAPAAPPPTPTEPVPSVPEPPPAPAPADMAPQPDYATDNYPPPADNTYAPFYDSLAPYGMWVDVAGYGPCWQPSVVIVNPGWQPYCNGGRWVYTDCGWYWLSGYSWGWAPFHYGRWFRHNHYGWCWMPGNTWGPSWVCWRHTGNYCGWAPLPPAAGYSAAAGLTFHGQRVNGSFAFGLGVKSYTFVPVSHFPDRQLSRYALPHQQAARIYNQTVPSVTIVGNGTRVVNQGIPVSHVAAASHSQIHTIGIREMNTVGTQGLRGEQLEANSRTLSVFRPQFPQSTGAQPVFGGRPRSDIRPTGGNPVAMPTSVAPRVAPVQSPRAVGGSPATQPTSGGGSGRRSDRSANGANAAPLTPTGSAPTFARRTSDPAPRLAQPLILRGSDRSREAADRTGASTLDQAAPRNSLIVRGNSRGSAWSTPSQSPAPATEVPQSRPAAPAKDAFSHPAGMQRTHPFTITQAERQAPAQPFWSSSRAIEPPVRSERPWQAAAPAYRAPTETPRSAPAPSYAPPRAQSYSPPTPSPAPRAAPTVSQPVHSPPSAPAASVPAAQSHFSSGRGWR
jgi:hypothetical protein